MRFGLLWTNREADSGHYRFQYTESASKDDEDEWRETRTSVLRNLFITISLESAARRWLPSPACSKPRVTPSPVPTKTYTRQCRRGSRRWESLTAKVIAPRTWSRGLTLWSSATWCRAGIRSWRRC